MKIENVKSEALAQEFVITIDNAKLKEKEDEWLQLKSKQENFKGFRPGKIPLNVMRAKFGPHAQTAARDDFVQEANDQIRKDFKLEDALQGIYEEKDSKDDFVFQLNYDIPPNFDLVKPEDFKLNAYLVKIDQKDIDAEIKRDLEMSAKRTECDKDYAIEKGDEVSFELTVQDKEDEIVENFNRRNIKLIVGSERNNLDNLEKKLVGLKNESEESFELAFAKDFPNEDLAGKKHTFKVNIKSVSKVDTPELNDEFAKSKECEDVDDYKQKVLKRLQAPFKNLINICQKRETLDLLDESYTFDNPERSENNEFKTIWSQLQRDIERAKDKDEELEEIKDKSEEELEKEYKKIAKRRVKLGFVIKKYAKEHSVEVTDGEIRQEIFSEAIHSPDYKGVIDYYSNNPSAVNVVRNSILENKTIELIHDKSQKKEISLTEDELKQKVNEILPGTFKD